MANDLRERIARLAYEGQWDYTSAWDRRDAWDVFAKSRPDEAEKYCQAADAILALVAKEQDEGLWGRMAGRALNLRDAAIKERSAAQAEVERLNEDQALLRSQYEAKDLWVRHCLKAHIDKEAVEPERTENSILRPIVAAAVAWRDEEHESLASAHEKWREFLATMDALTPAQRDAARR